MTSRTEQAEQIFRSGYNCSQSVFAPFCEQFGLHPSTALRIAQAFGGGMASRGDTCGAVTGAFMVLGLKHGKTYPEDQAAREKTNQLVHEFVRRFEAQHGSLTCRTLLGYDPGNSIQANTIRQSENYISPCPRLVSSAVAILEDIL